MDMVDFCAYSCFFISEITCFALSNISSVGCKAKGGFDDGGGAGGEDMVGSVGYIVCFGGD